MKNKNLPLILLVIVLVVGLLAAIYISGAVPNYNSVIDTFFSDIACLFERNEKEETPPVQDINEDTEVVAIIETEEPEKELKSDIYEIIDKGYTLSSAGKNRWYYESNWPILTEPLRYDNTVIVISAEPAFLTLSYETGECLSKQECPVYPGENAVLSDSTLTLDGRDGKTYVFQIESDGSFTDLRENETNNESFDFLASLKPEQKTAESMTKRIKEWTADDSRTLPDMKLFVGHINREGNGNFFAKRNEDAETVFYIYTPDTQGIYQIGLADENGVWIQANAFVAVFGENGDMKQVSIDYVANKPQVKLHLSETEMYYIVAGWAKDMYDGTPTWLQIAESH